MELYKVNVTVGLGEPEQGKKCVALSMTLPETGGMAVAYFDRQEACAYAASLVYWAKFVGPNAQTATIGLEDWDVTAAALQHSKQELAEAEDKLASTQRALDQERELAKKDTAYLISIGDAAGVEEEENVLQAVKRVKKRSGRDLDITNAMVYEGTFATDGDWAKFVEYARESVRGRAKAWVEIGELKKSLASARKALEAHGAFVRDVRTTRDVVRRGLPHPLDVDLSMLDKAIAALSPDAARKQTSTVYCGRCSHYDRGCKVGAHFDVAAHTALSCEQYRSVDASPQKACERGMPAPTNSKTDPKSQAEVMDRCGRGDQWCHVCTKWDCCDNDNPAKPKPSPAKTCEPVVKLPPAIQPPPSKPFPQPSPGDERIPTEHKCKLCEYDTPNHMRAGKCDGCGLIGFPNFTPPTRSPAKTCETCDDNGSQLTSSSCFACEGFDHWHHKPSPGVGVGSDVFAWISPNAVEGHSGSFWHKCENHYSVPIFLRPQPLPSAAERVVEAAKAWAASDGTTDTAADLFAAVRALEGKS